MRSKSIILLALALGCGLVASIGISQVMERRNQTDAAPGETEAIFVANNDINPNDPITQQNVKIEEWPKSKVPAGAVHTLEELENKRGRIKMFAGEPLLAAKIMGANEVQGATIHIPKGYRVVALRVDSVSGGGSLILPGDRVDVLVFLSRNENLGVMETSTKTILQDVKVFAVDSTIQVKPDQTEAAIAAKTISLLVTPQQAEKLTLATEMGSIRLVLRNQDDNVATTSDGASVGDVVGDGDASDRDAEVTKSAKKSKPVLDAEPPEGSLLSLIKQQPPAAPEAPKAGPWKMELLSGSELSEIQIGDKGTVPTVLATETPPSNPVNPADDTQDDGPADATPAADPNTPSLDAPKPPLHTGLEGEGVTED